jgi:hypothetical protein
MLNPPKNSLFSYFSLPLVRRGLRAQEAAKNTAPPLIPFRTVWIETENSALHDGFLSPCIGPATICGP